MGGTGGRGGDGAGGSISLSGSSILGGGSTIDCSGGGGGRFLVSQSGATSFSGQVVGARTQVFPGPRAVQPFVSDTPLVPSIPNLVGGAETFGVFASQASDIQALQSVVSDAPAGAAIAMARIADTSWATGSDFAGFDIVIVVNLSSGPISEVNAGFGAAAFGRPILRGGFARSPLFGGTGPEIINDLPSGAVYGFLIPEISGPASVFSNVSGHSLRATRASLRAGDVVYVGCVADLDDGSGTGSADGGVTVDDLLYFVSIFEDGVARADLDDGSGTGVPDGGVTIDDLLYFLIRYEVGC